MRKRPDEVLRQSPKSKVKVLKTTQVHKTLTFMQSKSFLQNVSVSSIAGYFSIQRERKWIIAKYLTHHEILELTLFFLPRGWHLPNTKSLQNCISSVTFTCNTAGDVIQTWPVFTIWKWMWRQTFNATFKTMMNSSGKWSRPVNNFDGILP